MTALAVAGGSFRLVIDIDHAKEVYAGRAFARFEEAQSRVAEAICAHASRGSVQAVRMERCGNPTDATAAASEEDPRTWITVKCWGADVVDRILTQHGLHHRVASLDFERAREAVGKLAGEEPEPVPADGGRRGCPRVDLPGFCDELMPERATHPAALAESDGADGAEPQCDASASALMKIGTHRPARNAIAATTLVLILAALVALWVQTGGRLFDIFAIWRFDAPPALGELPFNASVFTSPGVAERNPMLRGDPRHGFSARSETTSPLSTQ